MKPGETLERLLREQRAALRKGELEALAKLVTPLERAMQDLAPGPGKTGPGPGAEVGPQVLERLRRCAAENAVLLEAACAGLKRARALRDRGAAARLMTYDASGRFAPDVPQGRTLARK
ncbi:hypothetical protein [Roseicyclus sp.]|uniref:hypothetical protein n=1 Tax=Roseicyclus sp. TaxID=1914329 RepID=UPI003FA18806